ncbi:ABC transporter ATP-binding protein [Ancylobacter sp.]|uniref:ABC transporter ATP-binding protein n=1 Tax=Ancylobacter sp. TaxID=1872567 RepID=UPI003D0E919A
MNATAQTVAAAPHALVIEGVGRRFGALHAVRDVTIKVAEGERRAILGANGAGKTTLFNLVAGDLPPSQGRILMFGRDVTGLPVEKRVRDGLRRTYQTSLMFGGLTVRQSLFLAVRGVSGGRMSIARPASRLAQMETGDRLAERLRLTGVLDSLCSTLSHGERRQLELAMALAGEPRLLLLDEPAAGLSPREREMLLKLLLELPRAITLVMIEHDMDIALRAVDQVSVMHNGRLVAEGTPREIENDRTVHDIYMGKHVS